MRISGGSAKGRKIGFKRAFLRKGEAEELRPTSAKVREAIFNILGSRTPDAAFLDLYAGTGAIGIEALSRGARQAVFVEESAARVKIIRELVERFGFGDRAVVVKERADLFVKRTDMVFDVVFIDPPYASGELETILPLIDRRDVVSPGGVVVAEHATRSAMPSCVGSLELRKRYKYGDTSLSVYDKEEGGGETA